ncbi:signal recognition particle subunit SRP72 [Anopheles aquasalis]|uniref:signal recognition particle subunit SRP72 n=1 Tax=Anopheles aquasalis TaxID=42839 RepID=UPI00215B559E|nr:signal recognition particle subunit SRP72 [Anopheles aquasalis]
MSKGESKEATIRQLYTELNKYCGASEYDKALKTANKILTHDASEWKAAKCKLVCLIQRSKFEEVLRFLERHGSAIPDTIFEKAYAEYRLNRAEQALRTIQQSTGSTGKLSEWGSSLSPDLQELLAQVLYRLERFDECFELYRSIIKNTHDDYDDERRTNMSAVAANLAIVGDATSETAHSVANLPEDTYELVYNAACALAGRQQYGEAERKLRSSEKMCRESLEEDGATEEDIIDEITIIKVQLAYCLQMQGRVKEASALYADALRHKTNDAALTAVVSNNLVVINRDQNVFDSKKKMKVATSEQAEQKLTSRQRKTIAFNNCLLAYFASQPTECALLAARLADAHPDLEFQAQLVRVAQLARDKKYREAIESLEQYAQRLPRDRTIELLQVRFAIVQLQLVAGNRKAAIETLESLGEARYRPGVVSALVTLHLGQDNKQAASEILKSAVDWYKRQKGGSISDTDLSDMWRQAASFHLRGGEPETAAKSLEELLRTHPNDVKLLAQLVIAYAQFDQKRAQQASRKLPALDTLTTVSEIDALEATNWMMIAKAVRRKQPGSGGAGGSGRGGDQSPGAGTPGAEQQQTAAAAAARSQKRKKRKGKLPKNYDPDAQPDPERWLPRYERTGYRKKRDRRVKEIIKGSQGTASGQADQFDMSKAYNQTKQSPATPSTGVSQQEQMATAAAATRQLPRKSQHKKKKGKH